jgi:signal transduction histidine kinase
MLDDTLLFGKTETAKLDSNAKPLNLVRFCQELVAQIHSCSSQHRINFSSQGNCLAVLMDKQLLELILKNLLDNALKYSPSNVGVDLKLACEPEQVIFQVIDKGIGISVVDRKHLFEPFYRGSNIANLPGTGLGLSVVKTLVDLHGGHIDIESEVGKGTTFTVMLPCVKYEV